jgi:hypothetical protein
MVAVTSGGVYPEKSELVSRKVVYISISLGSGELEAVTKMEGNSTQWQEEFDRMADPQQSL